MRNISFSITKSQFRNRTKHATRRKGWLKVKVGDHLMGVEKGQGIPKGGHVVKLGEIVVTAVSREPLTGVAEPGELALEGFPDMTPAEFVTMYLEANGGAVFQDCTRIAFDYVDKEQA